MIKLLNENFEYNPIRSHINITFSSVNNNEDKVNLIVEDLVKNNFDKKKSKVLVFVSYRFKAEESAEELKKLLKIKKLDYADKVDFYHAGLDGSEREEKYENYKNGSTIILVATKAFGMGMDIPNVHYVYHLNPSSNFEDFLQEVGRAGRNLEANLAAGFSDNNPIKTNCIIAKDDFKNLKDKLKENQLTWSDVVQVQKTIFDYLNKFTFDNSQKKESFPLPLDLLDQYVEYQEKKYDETFFRVILYWLEKLKKIKLGTFTPTHIPITINSDAHNYSVVKEIDDLENIKLLHSNLIKSFSFQKDTSGFVMVDFYELKKLLKGESNREVWRLLFLAQKSGVLKIERQLIIKSTITRKQELDCWKTLTNNSLNNSPIIETVFLFASKILSNTKFKEQIRFENDELKKIANEAIYEFIKPENIFWKEFTPKLNNEIPKEKIAQNLLDDFKDKRSKFAFKIINFLPKSKHKSVIQLEKHTNKPDVIQLIYNGYRNNKEWESYVLEFKKDLYNLIFYIHKNFIDKNVQSYNIVDLMISLNIDSKEEDYFKHLIFIAKGLGYLRGNNISLVPMGIELFLLDETITNVENLNDAEKSIKSEFDESVRMKELRLLALECIANNEVVPPKKYDEFIKSYFKCASENDFIKLLEENFGEGHESLKAFRAVALNDRVKKLNENQLRVYKAPIGDNLQVIAGPGSGKTHTLTLRVARLIQEENVKPETILVLAYNRAVVVELKERLNKLFRELGYSKLIKKLKVFTFHGFCKYVLNQELEGLNFDQWVKKFLEINKTTPGNITQRLGIINYVFVDEFQDITLERLELLKLIAIPNETKICVIGDPNQSIYGYDRVNEGGERSPKPYYEDFKKLYYPKEHNLTVNYRSYIEILDKANELLSLNNDKFPMPLMEAHNEYKGTETICEFYDFDEDRTNWRDKLIELVNYTNENNKHYTSIAVMFRSNQEVFKAFNEIKKLNLTDIRIRIQGSKGNLFSTREFHYFIEKIKTKMDVPISINYFEKLNQEKYTLLNENKNWDEYLINVFMCITYEFKKEQEEGSTYRDLYEFIKDISLKDDGHFGKIYQQNIFYVTQEKPKREIVLTTMHKVKGIEYDAVLIPPSFSNLPQKIERDLEDKIIVPTDLEDIFEEERRLYYVAYTRAKRKLIVIKWKREKTLDNPIPTVCEVLNKDQVDSKLGLHLKEGIDKFTLYWGASERGRASFEVIKNEVEIGDEVILKKVNRAGYYFWEVLVNNQVIAQLSSNIPQKMAELNELSGFVVSSVYVHTYEETINSVRGAQYATRWTEESKKRGYIYLIDFSGFGKIIN